MADSEDEEGAADTGGSGVPAPPPHREAPALESAKEKVGNAIKKVAAASAVSKPPPLPPEADPLSGPPEDYAKVAEFFVKESGRTGKMIFVPDGTRLETPDLTKLCQEYWGPTSSSPAMRGPNVMISCDAGTVHGAAQFAAFAFASTASAPFASDPYERVLCNLLQNDVACDETQSSASSTGTYFFRGDATEPFFRWNACVKCGERFSPQRSRCRGADRDRRPHVPPSRDYVMAMHVRVSSDCETLAGESDTRRERSHRAARGATRPEQILCT